MADDVAAPVRHLRNFVIISCLIVFIILLFFYITGALSIILIGGLDDFLNGFLFYFDKQRKMNMFRGLFQQFIILWKYLSNYWLYWWQYRDSLTYFSENNVNYFKLKLYFATFFPYVSLFTFVFYFRAPIMDWRPFKKPESIHGDAHWATQKEIKKAGLFKKRGMLLGKNKGRLLVADGYQHALLFAPTGSGKGVGFVIPNLLFWEESAIVHDIKLENYELTSGWRKEKLKQKVFVWNPADPDGISHCYNPMDWISKKPGQMVDDVQKICNFLLPEQEFWSNEARAFLVGVMLYLCCDDNRVKSLGETVRVLRSDDVAYNLAVVLDTMGKKIHPVAYMNIASYLQKADKERSGVTSTANSSLELWSNPLIDTATSTSDFNLKEFKTSPHTVYVGLTPDNLTRLTPLMQIFYQQVAAFFTAKMPQPHEKYGVLLLMDEFPTLGKMEQFQAGIAYFRGYKVRLFLIVQDTEQLKGIYEESGMNSFLSNSTYRITFAANNMETANMISQLLGNKTSVQLSYNKPKYLDLNPGSRSLHVSHTQRALLLPQEVIGLPRDDQILLIESQPPIRSKKIKYYKDRFFTKRLLKKTFVPTQEPYDAEKVAEEREKKKAENAQQQGGMDQKTISDNNPIEG